MALISTERSVRERITKEIRGLAKSLGFDRIDGNVRDYLIEYHATEDRSSYLMSSCDGNVKKLRCFGVQVTSDEDWFALGNIANRSYEILVRAYYSPEQEGAGVNRLIDDLRRVRGAIFALGTNLDGVVDITTDVETSTPEILDSGISIDKGRMLQATIRYVSEKRNPDF